MRETGQSDSYARGRDADRPRVESTGSTPPGSERGQTTLDFATGISIFLLSLAFVLVFVPGMLQPFTGGTQDDTPASNRVADDLSQRLLGDAGEPYALDRECTRAFFNDSVSSDQCEFDNSLSLEQRVGVVDHAHVNVTLRGNVTDSGGTDILCWDDASGAYVERDDCDTSVGDTLLTRGPNPVTTGGKTVSARRVALLDGHDVTIEVVMW